MWPPGGQGVQVGDHSTQRNIYIQTYIETLVIKLSPTPTAGQVVATSRLALAQLPGAVVGFTGRDGELDVLARLVDRQRRRSPWSCRLWPDVWPPAKTTLAVEAGHAARQQAGSPVGVSFIDLHGQRSSRAVARRWRLCC